MKTEGFNSERHFYLYAKNHYKKTDTLEDLKKILGVWCGVDPEHITKTDIVRKLLSIAHPHLKSESKFLDFIKYLEPDYLWAFPMYIKEAGSEYDFQRAVIHGCLSILALTRVDEIDGSLGEADSNILPFSREHIENLEEKS